MLASSLIQVKTIKDINNYILIKKVLIVLSCAVILQACNTNPASNKSVDAAKTVDAKTSNLDIGAIKKQIIIHDFSKSEKVIIRKGLLKYIYDHTTGSNNHMVTGLSNFVFNFSDQSDYSLVSFENKYKMLAYAGTLEHQLRDKYIAEDISKWDPNSLLANFKVQWPNFIDEIKKENYYDDAEIKKAVTEAEQEAYQLTLKPDPE